MSQPNIPTDQQLLDVFNKIVSNRDESKSMLNNPAEVLGENGISVADSESFNLYFFDVSPNLKRHFLAGSIGKPDLEGIALCSSPAHSAKRLVCLSKITLIASGIIGLIVSEEGDPSPGLIQNLANLVKLSVATIKGIIKHTKNPAKIISEICSALGD